MFSLYTSLAVAIAMSLDDFNLYVKQCQQQAIIVKDLREAGSIVIYDFQQASRINSSFKYPLIAGLRPITCDVEPSTPEANWQTIISLMSGPDLVGRPRWVKLGADPDKRSLVTEDVLLRCAALPELDGIDLDDNGLTGAYDINDDGIRRFVEKSPNITWLNLSNSKISNRALSYVGKLKYLRYLDVSATRVSDAGIANLGDGVPLEHIGLAETQVSSGGVRLLTAIKTLRYIDCESTDVSHKCISELEHALPDAAVIGNDGYAAGFTRLGTRLRRTDK